VALSGECGYRGTDASTSAAITISYSGPDTTNQSSWVCRVYNGYTSAVTIDYGAFCITPGSGGALAKPVRPPVRSTIIPPTAPPASSGGPVVHQPEEMR